MARIDLPLVDKVRRDVVTQLELVGGRHDEPEIYDGEAGDPGLAGGPDSLSWEINGDIGILGVAGSAAIVMEVLHPSVMAGVFTQSTYATQPLRRARNTLGYVLRTTFGSTPGATEVVERVKRIHGRVRGVRADGVAYEALDPKLIAWVHTCIPWAVMTAYDRYRRPLSRAEMDRYLSEQAPIGRMAGADRVPESVDELEAFVERMRPEMAYTEQTHEFIRFLTEGAVEPDHVVSRREAWDRRMGLCASMSLMPEWARNLTGLQQPEWFERAYLRPTEWVKANIVRWAYPEPPCKQMALRRVGRLQASPAAA
jgi:uncharacterized protein (DUF2236 family)